MDPKQTLTYTADQYEALYQARPGLPEYEKWTTNIMNKVKKLEEEHATSQGSEPITFEELNKAIRKLQRNKSLGPDMIPNEMFIEADQESRTKFLQVLNNIHKTKNIPDSWRIGHLK